MSDKPSSKDIENIRAELGVVFTDEFTKTLSNRGYRISQTNGDTMRRMQFSNSVTNTAEARGMFARWAKALASGLQAMCALPATKPAA